MVFVYGFAGMRDHRGELSFNPQLPERLDRVRFSLTLKKQVMEVDIDQNSAVYSLRRGNDGLTLQHQGEKVTLTPESPVRSLPVVKIKRTPKEQRG